MRKLIVAGVAGLLAVMAFAGSAHADPRWGYGHGYRGYGYGYGPSVRFTLPVPVPPVVVNPYPYGYYSPGYYPPSYYYGPRVRVYPPRPYYWNHHWRHW